MKKDKKQQYNFPEDEIELGVKFQFMNQKNELEYSPEYKIKVALDNSDLEVNRIAILKLCEEYRTPEERFYYYMFDTSNNTFYLEKEELKPQIEKKAPLVFKSMPAYARQIIEFLDEEAKILKEEAEAKAKEEELSGFSVVKAQSHGLSIGEEKKLDAKMTLILLSKNYFEWSLFSDEFITNGGIKQLLNFIKYGTGNNRAYALNSLSKLMSFQACFEYIDRHLDVVDIIFDILMTSADSPNIVKCAYNFIKLTISINQENVGYLTDLFEKYAKKTNTQPFSQLVSFLSEKSKDYETKVNTLTLINIILTFSKPNKIYWVLVNLREAGIFEMLDKLTKYKEKDFKEQLSIFKNRAAKLISDSEFEVEIYKLRIKQMEEHCDEVVKNCNSFKSNQFLYEDIITNFTLYQKYVDFCVHYSGLKAPKKRMVIYDKGFKVAVDPTGLVDLEDLVNKSLGKEEKGLEEKCKKMKEELQKIEAINKELSEGKNLTNERVKELEEKIKAENDIEGKLIQKKKELQEQIAALEKKKSLQGDSSAPSGAPKTGDSEIPEAPNLDDDIPEAPNLDDDDIPEAPNLDDDDIPDAPDLDDDIPDAPDLDDDIPDAPDLDDDKPAFVPKVRRDFTPKVTKQKITVKAQTKNISWKRYLVVPEGAPNKKITVWDGMEEPVIDINEVVALFEKKAAIKVEAPKKEKKNLGKKILTDSKRDQLVTFATRTLPTIPAITKALEEMDRKTLTLDHLNTIKTVYMTDDERGLYKSLGPDGPWEKPDEYIIGLDQIPMYKAKINIFTQIYLFEDQHPFMVDSQSYIVPACEEIKNNKHFKMFLSFVLALGNILNYNNNMRAQADGFKLQDLKRIQDMKDTRGQSVFKFLTAQMNKQDSTFDGILKQFPQTQKAADYSLKENENKLNSLNKMYNIVKNLITNLPDDTFKARAVAASRDMESKIEKVKAQEEKNVKEYLDTLKYLGYKDTDQEYREKDNCGFFKFLLSILKSIDNNMSVLEIKKIKKISGMGRKINNDKQMSEIMAAVKNRVKKVN